jgi:hypothetical protein
MEMKLPEKYLVSSTSFLSNLELENVSLVVDMVSEHAAALFDSRKD